MISEMVFSRGHALSSILYTTRSIVTPLRAGRFFFLNAFIAEKVLCLFSILHVNRVLFFILRSILRRITSSN